MINLELPKRIEDTRALLRQFSEGGLRPISRKYDLLEQKEMPQELYDLAKLLGGGRSRREAAAGDGSEGGNRNGSNMSMVVSSAEICWGDVGLFLALAEDGRTCVKARIGLGVAAPTPIRTLQAEAFLTGREITEAALAEAGKIAAGEAKVRDSIRGQAWYRREMVEVLVRRVGLTVLERIKGIHN